MPSTQSLPKRRPDLVVKSVGDSEFVVKHPGTGAYFRIGMLEHFLLVALDGEKTADELRREFEQEFGEALSRDELEQFLDLVRSRNLLLETRPAGAASTAPPAAGTADDDLEDDDVAPIASGRQSLLYWRKSLFDPDALFTQWEPRLRFVWTGTFVGLSALLILAALLTAISNWSTLMEAAPRAVCWETAVVAWCTLVLVTMLHECAHGLTCKHFGGEVHEVGVLFIFFTPCLFCNVSDAWLIREKSRRLWITLAGGYSDLCVWAVAVLVWRITVVDSTPNYIAWVIATVCGTRVFFNFNPLARLDGYYLLCDWFDAPNLRPRAAKHWMQHVRWLFWGAERPPPTPNGKLLVAYGLTIWLFAIVFLYFVVVGLCRMAGDQMWGWILSTLLTTALSKRVFKGFFASEFMQMLTTRHWRTAAWVAVLAGTPAVMFLFPWRSSATGQFHIRPGVRSDVRAPVAGFLDRIFVEEGDARDAGAGVADLRVPDLDSLIVRKKAEIRESEANLTRLRAGSRPEQVAEQRSRVARAEAWRDLARRDLERAQRTLELDLLRMELEVKQVDTELDFSRGSLALASRLYDQGALAGETLRAERKRQSLLQAQHDQAVARRQSRETEGLKAAEDEVVRREKEVSETRAALTLLEAGSRPEDIEAETARRARLDEELTFLEKQQTLLSVRAPVSGVIATPRMRDRLGEYVEKGALICAMENVTDLQVEIVVLEQDVQGIVSGQPVELKARSLPFDTFTATVDRIAPSAMVAASGATAVPTSGQHTVTVYCKVHNADFKLKSGMTGFARICCGQQSLGRMLLNRGLRYLRTEFWW